MGRWRPHRAEIVVGVNGSADCRRAVEFGVREAVLRDADLVAVMAIAGGTGPGPGTNVSTGRIQAAEHRLRQFLQSVGTGGVDVTLVVTTLPAADVLIDRSRSAELLVLGPSTGSVSGTASTVRRCLDQASCPVVVVRPQRRQRRAPNSVGHPAAARLVGQR